MAFGFSPSDVVGAARLAWSLYEALKDCPEEVEKISKDLSTVYGILNHIKEDLDAPVSKIKSHGDPRTKLLETMVRDLKKTLDEVEKLVERYRHLKKGDGENKASQKDQMWVKMKWVVGQHKIKRLHQDISVHISRLGLLLTSMGNSSLKRIESELEEMRISASPHESLHDDDGGTEPSDQQSRQESRASFDPAKTQSQVLNHQTTHINTDGIFLHLLKPSEIVIINLDMLSPADQEEIADMILDCCSMACYLLYESNELRRTKYSPKSRDSAKKLFEKQVNDQFQLPQNFRFFELREWLSRIRHALDRAGEDSCPLRAIDSYARATNRGFDDAERIPRMKWPLGGVDASLCEESIVQAINLCNHLRYWEGAHWLEALHKELLEPTVDKPPYLAIVIGWLRHRALVLERTPRGPAAVFRPDFTLETRKRPRTGESDDGDARAQISPIKDPLQIAGPAEATP